jgi:hypothetical protein
MSEWPDACEHTAREVVSDDAIPTGLLDAHGRKLYRIKGPVGFLAPITSKNTGYAVVRPSDTTDPVSPKETA